MVLQLVLEDFAVKISKFIIIQFSYISLSVSFDSGLGLILKTTNYVDMPIWDDSLDCVLAHPYAHGSAQHKAT
jgi:hypothetical protein